MGDSGNVLSSCDGVSGAAGGGDGGDGDVVGLCCGDVGVLCGEVGDHVPGGLGTSGGGLVYSLVVTLDMSSILYRGRDIPMTLVDHLWPLLE